MDASIIRSAERGLHQSLTGSELVTETTRYVVEHALGRKHTMDGYSTPAQVLRKMNEARAASEAEERKRHADAGFEVSRALDDLGLASIFHPDERTDYKVHGFRTPNDDVLNHGLDTSTGTHHVSLARRVKGKGVRVGYGSAKDARSAVMGAIKDFNRKSVNESDTGYDIREPIINEVSKPNVVQSTSSVRKHLGGGIVAKTRDGRYYLLNPKATGGKLPKPGEEIDPSKHSYIGDGEWTPEHARKVAELNGHRVPAIKAVDEAEQDDIDHAKRLKAYRAAVKATDDASMAKVHFRMRHDISQPDHREAYNQLKRKHREARRAEAAAAEHVKGVLFAKDILGEDELNELSPRTLRDYITAAITDRDHLGTVTDYLVSRYSNVRSDTAGIPDPAIRNAAAHNVIELARRPAAKADKRRVGIERAADKLMRKDRVDEDRLDELSPATIRDYLTKAVADFGASHDVLGYVEGQRRHNPHSDKLKARVVRDIRKRRMGIRRAIDNLGDDTQRNIELPAKFGAK